jgi:hypothetical protein
LYVEVQLVLERVRNAVAAEGHLRAVSRGEGRRIEGREEWRGRKEGREEMGKGWRADGRKKGMERVQFCLRP